MPKKKKSVKGPKPRKAAKRRAPRKISRKPVRRARGAAPSRFSAPIPVPASRDVEPSFEREREKTDEELEENVFAADEEEAPEREEKEEELP